MSKPNGSTHGSTKRTYLAQMIIHETELRHKLPVGTIRGKDQTDRVKAARRAALRRIDAEIGIGRVDPDYTKRLNPRDNSLTYQQIGTLFNRHHSTIMFLLNRLSKQQRKSQHLASEGALLELAS